eukprot:TRINITY_DN83135_c0_g1_i1.p1 TRINITY_DN83135_c0_g1~~TRINITY_DN83135_c0_g1_i1.p1  ORF type:complete len:309 (-),score=45.20 TRINITY_DN83135_c0_g1_i1:61-918(-)
MERSGRSRPSSAAELPGTQSSSSSSAAGAAACVAATAAGAAGRGAGVDDDESDTLFRPCRELLTQITAEKEMLKSTQQEVADVLSRALQRAKSDSGMMTQFKKTVARGGLVAGRSRGGRPNFFARRRREAEPLHGPDRFYTDKSTYTGTHRHGGPEVVESGEERRVADLSELTRPGLRRGGTYFPNTFIPPPSKEAISNVSGQLKKKKNPSSASLAATIAGTGFDSMQWEQPKAVPRGPERFFYDSGSFTGTHRFGGPAAVPSGRFRGCHSEVVAYPARDKPPIF